MRGPTKVLRALLLTKEGILPRNLVLLIYSFDRPCYHALPVSILARIQPRYFLILFKVQLAGLFQEYQT